MRKTISLLTAAVALAGAASVQAYQAGDMIVRGGVVTVEPQKTEADYFLKKDTQLGLNFQYMLSNTFGLELLAATPFTHKVTQSGISGKVVGEVKHLPPTLSAVFYPLDASSPIQPYFGAGLNYTMILDESLNKNGKEADFKKLEVADSFGFATQVGVDYILPNNVILNAQIRHININTSATLTDKDGDKVRAYLDVDPTVYMIGVGYKF